MQIDPALTLRRTVKTILRTEGAKGLFKGLAPPLLSVCVYQGVCFASFQPALDIVQSVNASSRASSSASSASAGELFVAGSISGAATVVVTTPTDLLKIRLQVSSGGGGIAAMSVAAREIFAKQGIRGFYRGAVATLMRDTFSTGLYFCVYHEMKREMKRAEYNGVAGELMAGGIAGMLAWGSCLPCDVVKTRIQGGEKGMKWLPTFVKIYQVSARTPLLRAAKPQTRYVCGAFVHTAAPFVRTCVASHSAPFVHTCVGPICSHMCVAGVAQEAVRGRPSIIVQGLLRERTHVFCVRGDSQIYKVVLGVCNVLTLNQLSFRPNHPIPGLLYHEGRCLRLL